jgi:hypothetical protein
VYAAGTAGACNVETIEKKKHWGEMQDMPRAEIEEEEEEEEEEKEEIKKEEEEEEEAVERITSEPIELIKRPTASSTFVEPMPLPPQVAAMEEQRILYTVLGQPKLEKTEDTSEREPKRKKEDEKRKFKF